MQAGAAGAKFISDVYKYNVVFHRKGRPSLIAYNRRVYQHLVVLTEPQ